MLMQFWLVELQNFLQKSSRIVRKKSLLAHEEISFVKTVFPYYILQMLRSEERKVIYKPGGFRI